MKRNSFNPTRVVLVIVLIGGLYKVGAMVNPPPKGPPEPPKPNPEASAPAPTKEKPVAAATMQQQMKDRIKQQMEQAKMATKKQNLEKQYNHGVALSTDDGINAGYWQKVTMGATGFKQTEEQAAHKQEVTDKVNKVMASEMAKSHASASGTKPVSGRELTPTSTPAMSLGAQPH